MANNRRFRLSESRGPDFGQLSLSLGWHGDKAPPPRPQAFGDGVITLDATGQRIRRADRAYLIDLAHRMLGDIGAAEDVVQEAFLRPDLAEPGEVRDPRGWQTVVTSRRCLDRIRSAQRPEGAAERYRVVGKCAQPRSAPGRRSRGPADLDDEIGEALLILLQRLSPADRVSLRTPRRLPASLRPRRGHPWQADRDLPSAGQTGPRQAGGRPHATKREMADHELYKIT